MTPAVEHLVAAGVRPSTASEWLPAVQAACAQWGIDTAARIAGFLAQCAHESAGFTLLEENLNYSAETMAAVWPHRFAVLDANKKPVKDARGKNTPNKFALALHRQPEALANVVYGGRMGNGPIESGDGWLYRGRGLKQLTGADNYRRCGAALNEDFLASPDLLLVPKYAAFSAGWFWSANRCSPLADAGDIEGLTRRINGGVIGLADRRMRHERVLAAIT